MVNHAGSHIDYFREKALDCFIRGLERQLSLLLKTKNPTNLSIAYQFRLDYYNMAMRTAPFQNQHSHVQIPRPREIDLPPQVPPRRAMLPPPRRQPFLQPQPTFQQKFQTFPQPQPMFQQRFQAFPQPQQPFQNGFQQFPQGPVFQRQYPPQRPFFQPKPLPKPEPMEVDQSIRSRNLNYGNRPDFKRPRSSSNQFNPFKRQAHPLDNFYYPDNEYDYDELPQDETYEYDEEYDDNTETVTPSQQTSEETQQTSSSKETNFLDWNPEW